MTDKPGDRRALIGSTLRHFTCKLLRQFICKMTLTRLRLATKRMLCTSWRSPVKIGRQNGEGSE